MLKNILFAAFFTLLCFSFSFAQTSKKSGETNWEFLQISEITRCKVTNLPERSCRKYSFLTSDISFDGQTSLEWMKESSWDLVSVTNADTYYWLYFKRRLNKTQTEKEIENLKSAYKESYPKQLTKSLLDLDEIESQQKLEEFNKADESKLRTRLEKIKNLPLEIISVQAKSADLKSSDAIAEVVLDATSILLKDGKYRASEADKYFQENAKVIFDTVGLTINQPFTDFKSAKAISKGYWKLEEIGEIGYYSGGVIIKISVIVNQNNQQHIVAQYWIRGKWQTDSQ